MGGFAKSCWKKKCVPSRKNQPGDVYGTDVCKQNCAQIKGLSYENCCYVVFFSGNPHI